MGSLTEGRGVRRALAAGRPEPAAASAARTDSSGGRASIRHSWCRTTAVFAAVMGVLLTGTWVVLLGTGQVVELATRPLSTWSLLAAEFTTAGFLVAGAAGVTSHRAWAGRVLLVGLGLLLYTTVNTIGVSAEQGIYAAAAWMALVAAGTVVLIARSLREGADLNDW